MLQRLAGIGRNRYVMAVVTGWLAGVILLLFFLLLRGQRDTIILQVQPVSDPLAVQVYVGGEVSSPGLYSLRRGSRVADAVTLAGGLLPAADTAAIGMAAVLEDADQIIVPARRPTPQPAIQAAPVGTPIPVNADATILPDLPTQPPPEESGPVNINTASIDALDDLPGIGPVIAGRIVEYRLQHGPFQTLEELEEVAGISMRMVEELRPLISLGS
ncbi:MAG: ComEA family DNA-binding protein [Chloroflexia bacterium]|nr:ComEA family DNA-binding protein [Chloroflexia bacterium]